MFTFSPIYLYENGFYTCRAIKSSVRIAGLKYVDGLSHNLEAGEVATSTPFMALRVTGLIETSAISPPSLMVVGRDSYDRILVF